eukprot:gene17197-biopygen7221
MPVEGRMMGGKGNTQGGVISTLVLPPGASNTHPLYERVGAERGGCIAALIRCCQRIFGPKAIQLRDSSGENAEEGSRQDRVSSCAASRDRDGGSVEEWRAHGRARNERRGRHRRWVLGIANRSAI